MPRKPVFSLNLDRRSKTSLQEQLCLGLKQKIQWQQIAGGDSLPSSRDLARELRISRNTVIAVYDRLLGEGYLESRPRSGIFVSSDLHQQGMTNKPVKSTTRPIIAKRTVVRLTGPRPFRPCQPDVELFPSQLWNRLRIRALRKSGTGLFHYQSDHALGLPALRQALAEYLTQSRGVQCDWEQIAITSGSQQAIYLLSQLLVKLRDRVLVEDPGYLGARQACLLAGAKLVGMKVDEQGAIPPTDASGSRLIYVTPSRQFPTGACMPIARRLAFIELARASKAWLVEDDYDSEFRYTRPPLPSLQSLDGTGRVIYLGSMSKVLIPALRIGYMVLPKELLEPFTALRLVVEDHGPMIDQATLAEFIDTGAFFSHIRRCRKVYAQKLEVFLDVSKRLGLPIHFPNIDGGMNQCGYLEDGFDARRISSLLDEAGLMVPSLDHYAMKPCPNALVFGFTAFDHPTIKTNLGIIDRVIRSSK